MEDPQKIQTLHPQGKKAVRIDRAKYDPIRETIIEILQETSQMKPMKLLHTVADRLEGQIQGSIAWYAETVKLDMEARGELEHDRKQGLLWLTSKIK